MIIQALMGLVELSLSQGTRWHHNTEGEGHAAHGFSRASLTMPLPRSLGTFSPVHAMDEQLQPPDLLASLLPDKGSIALESF